MKDTPGEEPAGGTPSGTGVPRPGQGARRTVDPVVPDASALAGMGVQFLVAILLCLFAGRWLDARLGTSPWLMIVGVLVGAGVSTVAMYRRVFPAAPPSPPDTHDSPHP